MNTHSSSREPRVGRVGVERLLLVARRLRIVVRRARRATSRVEQRRALCGLRTAEACMRLLWMMQEPRPRTERKPAVWGRRRPDLVRGGSTQGSSAALAQTPDNMRCCLHARPTFVVASRARSGSASGQNAVKDPVSCGRARATHSGDGCRLGDFSATRCTVNMLSSEMRHRASCRAALAHRDAWGGRRGLGSRGIS
jgi:hypothetical protein